MKGVTQHGKSPMIQLYLNKVLVVIRCTRAKLQGVEPIISIVIALKGKIYIHYRRNFILHFERLAAYLFQVS